MSCAPVVTPRQDGGWQQDFSADHVGKTVTVEAHPNLSWTGPTIHPCRHAEAMKKMISMVTQSTGGNLDVK